MRHRKAGRALGRNSGHRRALYRALVTSVLEHERIETTVPKAKELRSFVEKMITLGKRGDLAARRRALAFIRKESVVRTLFSDIAPRFANRAGGYTRVMQTRRRLGDGAPMAVIELTELKPKVTTAGPEKKAKGAKKDKPEAEKAKAAG
ncbi:MAG: 50S ribosomal protein L17 [Nitrospirota bacterium]